MQDEERDDMNVNAEEFADNMYQYNKPCEQCSFNRGNNIDEAGDPSSYEPFFNPDMMRMPPSFNGGYHNYPPYDYGYQYPYYPPYGPYPYNGYRPDARCQESIS